VDQRTVKVAMACLIGTSIGIITMLGIYPALWPLGLITGLIGGYLSYEYKKVIQAVPTAWNVASSWRPNMKPWREFFSLLPLTLTSYFITIILPVLALIYYLSDASIGDDLYFSIFLVVFIQVLFGIIMAATICSQSYERDKKNLLTFCRSTNFFLVYFYYLPKGAKWLFVGIPSGFSVIGRFAWNLFKLIHSDVRLLCGIDSAIGALVFHVSGGNVLLGLLVGVLGGVLNYEILSKRVLKLVPMR